MSSASVETARFEQLLSRPDLHEAADVVTVRAVRVETRTLMTLQAFLKPDGQLFWFRERDGPIDPHTFHRRCRGSPPTRSSTPTQPAGRPRQGSC